MTTSQRPPAGNEPLTPDERAWAERLARIGPHDVPSMELDSRILAAARAAVAQRPPDRRRRRWPPLVGAAASLVIVVGLAWQLQPLLRSRPSLGEVPAAAHIPRSEGSLSADVLAAADPVARTPPGSPGPAIAPAARRQASPPPPRVAAEPQVPPTRPAAFGDDAIPPYSQYAGTAAARQAASQAAANATSTGTSNTPRERPAPAAPRPFPAETAGETGTPMPAPPAPATAESVEQRRVAPMQDAPVATTSSLPPMTQAKAKAEHDDPAPHRIEATGPRLPLAGLPVREDTRLEAAAWLQRIRDRRDAADLDGARKSLALFRESHPGISLPDDLARLDD